jgi:hypothetical protein
LAWPRVFQGRGVTFMALEMVALVEVVID